MVKWDDGWGTWEGPDRNEELKLAPLPFSSIGLSRLYLNGEEVLLSEVADAKSRLPGYWTIRFKTKTLYEPKRYKLYGIVPVRRGAATFKYKIWFGSTWVESTTSYHTFPCNGSPERVYEGEAFIARCVRIRQFDK